MPQTQTTDRPSFFAAMASAIMFGTPTPPKRDAADFLSLSAACPPDAEQPTDLEHALGCLIDDRNRDRCGE